MYLSDTNKIIDTNKVIGIFELQKLAGENTKEREKEGYVYGIAPHVNRDEYRQSLAHRQI